MFFQVYHFILLEFSSGRDSVPLIHLEKGCSLKNSYMQKNIGEQFEFFECCPITNLLSIKKIEQERDSTLAAMFSTDSIKVNHQYKRRLMLDEFKDIAAYQVIDAGAFPRVVPVDGIDGIPDPNLLDDKLFFPWSKFHCPPRPFYPLIN